MFENSASKSTIEFSNFNPMNTKDQDEYEVIKTAWTSRELDLFNFLKIMKIFWF